MCEGSRASEKAAADDYWVSHPPGSLRAMVLEPYWGGRGDSISAHNSIATDAFIDNVAFTVIGLARPNFSESTLRWRRTSTFRCARIFSWTPELRL
jgi:hypothetical protein